MHAAGKYSGAHRDMEGNFVISFAIGNDMAAVESLQKLQDKELVIEAKKQTERRSLNANAYFWVLCDKIAETLKTTKECIYLMQLSRYGVFVDVDVIKDALYILEEKFRYTEIVDDYGNNVTARCYFGSSTYSKEEMSRLIDGTVTDAKEIGVDTWTPDEIARALATWEPRG